MTVSPSNLEVNIIGVVSGYRTQDEPITMRGVPSTELIAQGNSGLVVAYSLQFAINAIEKNPVGYPIKQ